MRRSSKIFVLALLCGGAAWFAGTMAVGVADVKWFTTTATIDIQDALQVSRALADPTFTSSYSWGSFTLVGTHWSVLIPYGAAFLAIGVVILTARMRRKPRSSGSPEGTA